MKILAPSLTKPGKETNASRRGSGRVTALALAGHRTEEERIWSHRDLRFWGGYRLGLRSVVGASATAYGYTLTVGPSIMLLTGAFGPPKPFEVLLFRSGAIVAFALVGAWLSGREGAFWRPSEKDPAVG